MLEREWRNGNPPALLVGIWMFLRKLKIELLYDPIIPHLDIYPAKTTTQKDTCTPMFTAALFTTVRIQKQPKCPSAKEWIMMYIQWNIIHPLEGTKQCHLQRHGQTSRSLQSEISQKEKNKYHNNIAYMWNLEKWYRLTQLQSRDRDTDGENKLMDTKAEWGGGMSREIETDVYTLLHIKR